MNKCVLPLCFLWIACVATNNYHSENDDPYFYYPNSDGILEKQDLTGTPEPMNLTSHHFNFHFYCRKNLLGSRLNIINASKLDLFDPSKETLFIIHGWSVNYTSAMPQMTKDAYLNNSDVNVFVVDWSHVSQKNYLTARSKVEDVGKFIAQFILGMVTRQNLNLNNTGIVGHSLGAHVAGMTGAFLNGLVDHIIGLDPAGPLFLLPTDQTRLNKTYGQYVQVIHTCVGLLGHPNSLGDVDFWPNGGNWIQPGCGLDIVGSCSHARSYEYYVESLGDGIFVGRRCSIIFYRIGLCNFGPKAIMGEDGISRNSNGNYYLSTNSEYPFAKQSA